METNWAKEVDYLHEEGMRRYDNTQVRYVKVKLLGFGKT